MNKKRRNNLTNTLFVCIIFLLFFIFHFLMKKSSIALLSIWAVCIVAGGWYAIQNMSSTTPDKWLFSTQSTRSQCINNEQEYISCRKEWMSEKFCLIKQSTNRETGKSCLSKIPEYSKSVDYTTPVEDEHEIYTDRVTIMLSEKNTGRKTIVTDYNNTEESAVDYTTNWLRQETIPFEKELMNYLNVALDAYSIKSINNWSSYFASLDENVNPNIIDIIFTNETDIWTFVAELQSKIDQDVVILPVYKKTLYSTPNDPQAGSLWYLQGWNGVHAYKAWDQLVGKKLVPVTVWIVDDWFDLQHEDLRIISAVPEWAWGGHGTHVVWLVGAVTDNEKWIASAVRNKNNLLIMRWYNFYFWNWDYDGSSNIMWLVQQAVQDGAKVINMSRWGGGYSAAEAQIFQAVYNMWVVLIAAAGNESANQPSYPARYPGVISVGASNTNGLLSTYSNKWADLKSPGNGIISTCLWWWYCDHSGTSMATAIASSVASLLLTINSSLSPDEIETILQSTTNPQWVINACNAVAQLLWNNAAVVCGDDTNTWGEIWENCLWDSECKSWVCEEIIEAKCVSGKYWEKLACKWFTTEEQCLGFKQDVWTGVWLVSVCAWEENIVWWTCVPQCGNGVLEWYNGNNEQCDDWNTNNWDWCDATCKREGCSSDNECNDWAYCQWYVESWCYKNTKNNNPNDDNQWWIPDPNDYWVNTCAHLEKDVCNKTENCEWFDEYKWSCKVPVCGDWELDPGEECELQKWWNIWWWNSAGNDGNVDGDSTAWWSLWWSTTAWWSTSWECINCKKVYKESTPTCGNNIIEKGEQCDGSGCAKWQTCAPAGSKNACTCEDGMIIENTPTPPTRDDWWNDR